MKYRLGRKQKLALLTQDGHFVAMFSKGKEEVAQKVVELLNKEHNGSMGKD